MVRTRAGARAQTHPLPNEVRGRAQDAKNVYCFSLSRNTSLVDANLTCRCKGRHLHSWLRRL